MRIALDWIAELLPASFASIPAEDVAAALTARGLTVDASERTEQGVVFDLDVPANRPDCLGHLGVAREIGAAFGLALRDSAPIPESSGPPTETVVRVTIADPAACARYTAGLVRGVRVGASPPWVRDRLDRCGLRSVNNVVDASNLVMLELGQPVHFFDLARVEGPEIRVRRASEGESLVTLDGVERRLDPSMLVIADARRPIAVAGVLGGAHSEIGESTRDVLVEAAWFEPASVRATARRLGVSTDASQRFERGCDPEAPPAAQRLSARRLAELALGVAAPGMLDVRGRVEPRGRATVRLARAASLLGYPPSEPESMAALEALSLAPVPRGAGVIEVEIPSFRVDLEREADLVEEIGRHLGYDRIPARPAIRLTSGPAQHPPPPEEEHARDLLAHLGFHEAFNYAMIGDEEDTPFVPPGSPAAIPLTNPIAENLSHLRRSLAPGLLRASDLNLRRGNRDVRLFEVGRVFRTAGDPGTFPDEPLSMGLTWAGASAPRHWSRPGRDVDLHDVAGAVEAALYGLAPGAALRRGAYELPGLHPGRTSGWTAADGSVVAWCGEVHPALARRMGLAQAIFLAEADLLRLASLAPGAVRYAPIPRVPSVTRDLSIHLPPSCSCAALLERLAGVPSPAPASFEVIDRFSGETTGGAVSLTVRVMLQPLDRTLTDAETEGYRQALIRGAESLEGVRIRG